MSDDKTRAVRDPGTVPLTHEELRYLKVMGDVIPVDPHRRRPKPFHSPGDALQAHLELLDWMRSEDGFDVVKLIHLPSGRRGAQSAMGEDGFGNPISTDDPKVVEGYRSVLVDTLNFNNTMYVSAHMCDELQALIPSFENEPLWWTDLPDDKGVVLFEASIRSVMSDRPFEEMTDDSSIEYFIKGFAYRRVVDHAVNVRGREVDMTINISSGKDDADEPRMKAFEANDGILIWPLFDAGEMFVAPGQWENNGEPPVLPMPFVAIPFGANDREMLDDGTDLYQMRQLAVTLFRLVWQHIVVEETTFQRPERRRMQRLVIKHRFALDGEEIKVRHLRRLEGEEGTSTPRDIEPREGHALTYRIIVRGHPRDQWYASLGPARVNGEWNPDSHRRIWINAHIRGPEHAPLVLKHSLDVVVR